MNRREFQAGLILSGLSAAGPACAFNDEKSRNDRVSDFSRIQLKLAAVTITLTWFIVYAQSGLLGLNLAQPSRRFDEDRPDTGKVPILGSLTRPLLPVRFAGAAVVGHLVLLQTMLILLPSTSRKLAGKSLVVANRDQSWEPGGKLQPVRMSTFPTMAELKAREKLGTCHLKGNEILANVAPSIVKIDG